MRLFRGTLAVLGLTLFVGGFTACKQAGDQVAEDGTEADIVAAPDPNSFVCNPFEEGIEVFDREQGVHAHLQYLDSSQPRYSRVSDYLEFGNHVDEVDIYFNRLFVPTRPFDRGFVTRSGEPIQTPAGDTLYEYFSMKFTGNIHLGPNDQPGKYQFALLSDDGSVFKVDRGGGLEVLVDNDGNHPTRMGCNVEAIDMDENTVLPFELDYFQGPRFHISLALLWRELPENGHPEEDPFCGLQGNTRFWNYRKNPPEPTSYNALLARGWKTLAPENYSLPVRDEPPSNPCNEPAPNITEYAILAIGLDSVTIWWITDRPATSQVEYRDVATGEQFVSPLDEVYKTEHLVTITGLKSNSLYEATAVSASTSGRSTSAPIIFRTRR